MRIGRASSLDAARTTWASAAASSALASVTGSPAGLGEARELVGGQHAQAELATGRRRCGPRRRPTSTDTLPAGSARTMSDASRPGQHHDAVAVAGHGDLDGDRELEVGAGEAQLVARELHPDTGEHGQGRATTGRRPASGAEGLDEDITLASELHAGARFLPSSCASQRRSGGRGCGLGMTRDRAWSGGVWLSHRDPQDPTGV